MAGAIISALLQLCLVLVIAYAAYWILRRPQPSFREFIAFTRASGPAVLAGVVLGLAVASGALLFPRVAEVAARAGTSAHEAAASQGLASVLVIAFFRAVIQTSLSEEILFRGLIGKNLIRRLGFLWGNTIQAALFGAIHGLIGLIPGVGLGFALFAILFAGAFGWLNGWLNEGLGRGSILPGWAAHATANFATILIIASQAKLAA